jgi:hypothetical protein
MKISAREILEAARRQVHFDPGLAAFMVRDLPETETAELKDLAWAMHLDGNASKNDAILLLDKLEAYLDRESDNA